jgi:ABC-type glycerol-3-phosphate transport system permease component
VEKTAGMKTGKRKIRDRFTPVKIMASVVFGVYAVSLLLPLLWAFMMSFKTPGDYMQHSLEWPHPFMFSNYAKAFTELSTADNNVFGMLVNSLWLAGGEAFLAMAVGVTCAYACAKYDFFGGKVVFWLSFVVMIIPIVNNLPGQFRLAKLIHTYDSPLTVIAAAGCIGGTFLILYTFFKNVDPGYAEAAFIDGASHFQVFFRVMLPIAFPPVAAIGLVTFTGLWNDSMSPLIFLPSYPTLASGLYIYQAEVTRSLNYPVLFAGLFLSALPIMALFILFQKHLMELQLGGGFKG